MNNLIPKTNEVQNLGTDTMRWNEVNAKRIYTWKNGVKEEVYPGAGGGSGTNLEIYLQKDENGDLMPSSTANETRGLPLPIATPTPSDYGKAVKINSSGTAFEYGVVASSSGDSYFSKWWQTPGTYAHVVPADSDGTMTVYGCGGGGGGNGSYGLPGGGAECAFGVGVPVIPSETLTIVVGAGGTGAAGAVTSAAYATAGGTGGNTTISGSFGTITLHGGGGGYSNSGKYDPGPSGGSGGQRGGFPANYSTDSRIIRCGGKGGDTLFGTGGQGGLYPDAPSYGSKVDGTTGLGFGSGGGGGGHIFDSTTTSTSGGAGAKGMVFLEWKLI